MPALDADDAPYAFAGPDELPAAPGPGPGRVGPLFRDRTFDPAEPPRVAPWVAPLALLGAGVALTAGAALLAADRMSAGLGIEYWRLAGLLAAGAAASWPAQFVFGVLFLSGFGVLAGIEYGPARTALPRLAAAVVFAGGLAGLALTLLCPGLAALVCWVAAVALLRTLFPLAAGEAALTALALGALSMTAAIVVGGNLLAALVE